MMKVLLRGRDRRWTGDCDKHIGPFTFSYSESYRPIGFVLDSGEEEDEGCHFRVHILSFTFIVELPPIVKPYKKWVPYKDSGFWEVYAKEYGVLYSGEGFVRVLHGEQTNSSDTDKSKGYFLPWTQWRHIRRSFYDVEGKHFWTEDKDSKDIRIIMEKRYSCPSVVFLFKDFDGEIIEARTIIEEMEWKFGEGWFKWLSFFVPNKVNRYLDITFNQETGRRKGSWKGGIIGTGENMFMGETHEDAFKRYCRNHNMVFIGKANNAEKTGT